MLKIEIENKDRVLCENCFITKNNVGVYAWYGFEYIEFATCSSKQDLYDLKECIDAMIEEINRLKGLTKG